MDIQKKQAKWNQERPLFEAELVHSYWLQFFNFNNNTGDYELKESLQNDEDAKLAFEVVNTGWVMWLRAKAQKVAVPEGFVLVKNVHPDSIVHNQGLGLFRECMIIYGWKNKSDDFKDALNKGFYHGLKLGVRTVLEKAMIEAQEQA